MITIQRVWTTASKYTRPLPLLEPFRALHRQLCVPSHRHAHVVSDDRSHSSTLSTGPRRPRSLRLQRTFRATCTCAFANITSLLLVRDQGAPPSVPPLELSALRHAIAIPLILISALSLIRCITVTVNLHPIARLVRCRTSENTSSRSLPRLALVHDAAFRMGDALVLPTVSNATCSSQPFAPQYIRHPARCSLVLVGDEHLHTKYHAALTLCCLRAVLAPFISDMDGCMEGRHA
ncbi:hypothetical protein B0H14DRAFT_700467 [Mycena olivaceomarginata]|nr:hypothetical protein B0H14DRAFT_700467 [Mycena olivaceomarginata]